MKKLKLPVDVHSVTVMKNEILAALLANEASSPLIVLTVKAKVKVPTVPNFLIGDGDMKFPLSAFDDEALRQIANAWLTDLLNNAERQRIEARNAGGDVMEAPPAERKKP